VGIARKDSRASSYGLLREGPAAPSQWPGRRQQQAKSYLVQTGRSRCVRDVERRPGRVRAVYGEANYARLAAVKAEWIRRTSAGATRTSARPDYPPRRGASSPDARSACGQRAARRRPGGRQPGAALPPGAGPVRGRPPIARTGPDPQEPAEPARDAHRWRGAGGARWSGPSPRTPDVPAMSSRSRPRLTEGDGRVRRAHGHRLASPRRTAACRSSQRPSPGYRTSNSGATGMQRVWSRCGGASMRDHGNSQRR
jgi:hypothetical protein